MSSTLQIGLAIAGGVVLAALVVYNQWQLRKLAPRQPDTPPATDMPPAGHTADTPASTSDDTAQAAARFALPSSPERKALLDPLLDALAPIVFDDGVLVAGDKALAALPATRRVDNKPFAIEGHDCASGQWEPITPGHWYDAFQAGVQLANRSGALNEIGFSEFTVKTQAFADAVNGTPHIPDMVQEVARARELDHFANTHDARLSFLLKAERAAWSAAYLHQHATAHGFVAGALPGRLILPARVDSVPPILRLEFDTQAALADDVEKSAIYEAIISLEIAHVPPIEQPFDRMCRIALQMAHDMGGVIVDGRGRRIEPAAMQLIAADLQELYQWLADRQFAAGSLLARRLFS